MKLKKLSFAASLILAGAFNSHAASFTVAPSFLVHGSGVGGLLTGGNSGSFDLRSVTPASAYPLPLRISSAMVTFYLSDDTSDDYISLQGGGVLNVGSYHQNGNAGVDGGGNYLYTFLRDVTQLNTLNQIETGEAAQLYMGTANALVGTAETTSALVNSSSHTVGTGTSFDYQTGYHGSYTSYYCGFLSTCYKWNPGEFNRYYTNNYIQTITSTFSTTGTFSIASNITSNTPLLNELMTTGMLPFQLNLFGDAVLTGATLQVVVVPVPEADSYAYMLAGLGLIGYIVRRRAKAATC